MPFAFYSESVGSKGAAKSVSVVELEAVSFFPHVGIAR